MGAKRNAVRVGEIAERRVAKRPSSKGLLYIAPISFSQHILLLASPPNAPIPTPFVSCVFRAPSLFAYPIYYRFPFLVTSFKFKYLFSTCAPKLLATKLYWLRCTWFTPLNELPLQGYSLKSAPCSSVLAHAGGVVMYICCYAPLSTPRSTDLRRSNVATGTVVQYSINSYDAVNLISSQIPNIIVVKFCIFSESRDRVTSSLPTGFQVLGTEDENRCSWSTKLHVLKKAKPLV